MPLLLLLLSWSGAKHRTGITKKVAMPVRAMIPVMLQPGWSATGGQGMMMTLELYVIFPARVVRTK